MLAFEEGGGLTGIGREYLSLASGGTLFVARDASVLTTSAFVLSTIPRRIDR
jgi:hypothetical protein